MKIFSKMFNILKPKIPTVKNGTTNPALLNKKNIADRFELSAEALETKLMNEVRQYGKEKGLETIRIIDKNGNIMKIRIVETPLNVSFPDESFISLFLKMEDSTFIHNHNIELPLSFTDIMTMFNLQISKMTATTPSGKFSSLIFPKNKMMRIENDKVVTPDNLFKVPSDIEKLSIEEIELLKKLKIFDNDEIIFTSNLNNASKETINELAKWRNKKIQELSDKYGFEYKTDIIK